MRTRTIQRAAAAAAVATVGLVGFGSVAGAQEPAAPSTPYTVQAGDTLSRIAPDNWREVAAGNGIDNPDLIIVGQVIDLSRHRARPRRTRPRSPAARRPASPAARPAGRRRPARRAARAVRPLGRQRLAGSSGAAPSGTSSPSASPVATGRSTPATATTAACSSRRAAGTPPAARQPGRRLARRADPGGREPAERCRAGVPGPSCSASWGCADRVPSGLIAAQKRHEGARKGPFVASGRARRRRVRAGRRRGAGTA